MSASTFQSLIRRFSAILLCALPILAQSSENLWLTIPKNLNPQDYLNSSRGTVTDRLGILDDTLFESSEPVVVIEDPLVQKTVKEIVGNTKDTREIAIQLTRYFADNFKYINDFEVNRLDKEECLKSIPQNLISIGMVLCRWGSSWRTLRTLRGDCLGAAYSVAALFRAAGIPALIAYTRPGNYAPSPLAKLIPGGYGKRSHYYVYAYLGDEWYFVEPQNPLVEFRTEPYHRNQYKNGIIQTDEPIKSAEDLETNESLFLMP